MVEMKMLEKKKLYIVIFVVLLAIAISIAIYFIIKNKDTQEESRIVNQESLTTSSLGISLGDTDFDESTVPIYTVSQMTSLSKVQAFVQTVDPLMELSVQEEGVFYEWVHGENYVDYILDQNYLIFNIEEGLNWNEATLTNYSFSQFVKQYFDKSWEYTLSLSYKLESGETLYYAKRNEGGVDIETVLDRQQTDYLAMKDGRIVYGKILLVDLILKQSDYTLISMENLKKYINLSAYPKEIYPQYGALQTVIPAEIDYKSEEYQKIVDTLSNCASETATLIYLYKRMDQGDLTPVFKLDLSCTIKYENIDYDVPAIGYISAIDPAYISAE